MQVYRVGIKFLLAEPALLRVRDVVPVFHTWIQKQAIPGHLLVDVHDYSHIHWGPGILLVAHEANFSIDMDQGKTGLFYYRKQPLDGSTEQRVESILKPALQGCCLLEEEPSFEHPLRFRTDEFVVVANDRLQAPNDAGTFAKFEPALSGVVRQLTGGAPFKLTPVAANSKERFMIRVETGQSATVRELLERL